MRSRSEKALDYFKNGFNCAQSVFISFEDILNLNEETALKVASGFGGGMGGMQGTCGAVSGSLLVIGFLKGKYKEGDDDAKEITNQLIQEFTRKFEEKYQTINCRKLIDLDFNTKEGEAKAIELDVYNKKCTTFITYSISILENLLLTKK